MSKVGALTRKILHAALFDEIWAASGVDPVEAEGPEGRFDMWAGIKRGEFWRLLTPIFIHYGLMHIVLNMIWLYSFGAAVEDRRGSLIMLLLVLVLAVSSNVGQAFEASLRERGALFGGMSGVGYGLFGYMAIKAKFDSRERYFLSPGTTFMALLWFAAGLAFAVVIAVFLVILVSCLASRITTPVQALVLSATFTLFCVLIFHYLLHMPIPLWGELFTG
jgi:membrane associated rhomboid family serine protease